MANVADPNTKPPLGIGSILSQSMSILFGRFLLFFAIAFAVQLVALLLNRLFVPTAALLDPETAVSAAFAVGPIVSGLLALVASSVTTGIIVLGAYDAWLGNPSRPGAYLGAALAAIVPLVVLSIVVNVVAGLGLVLLILPGLYVLSMWSVVTPAIVAEGAGFGALGRSLQLTSGYRWSIVGLLVVLFVIIIAIQFVVSAALGAAFGVSALAPTADQFATLTSLPYQLAAALPGALMAAFAAVLTAVLYARLKEIKEGVGYEDLGTVFE